MCHRISGFLKGHAFERNSIFNMKFVNFQNILMQFVWKSYAPQKLSKETHSNSDISIAISLVLDVQQVLNEIAMRSSRNYRIGNCYIPSYFYITKKGRLLLTLHWGFSTILKTSKKVYKVMLFVRKPIRAIRFSDKYDLRFQDRIFNVRL